jgi:hypothetical protein
MVVGFNHNFRYQGELYHVQTEDSGVRNPHIVTLLYTGGSIIASRKTSYAHLLQSDNLEKQVEEIMKAQHREMLRRLRDGELDGLIARAARVAPADAPATQAKPASPPTPAVPRAAPPESAKTAKPASAAAVVRPAPAAPVAEAAVAPPAAEPPKERVVEVSLDDLILSYLAGDDKP